MGCSRAFLPTLIPSSQNHLESESCSAAMAKLDESLRLLHYDENEIPSSQQFLFAIEPQNVPAVFRGAVKNWDAISKWDPYNGGLDYLEERVGSANVDAMLSSSAPVFYGDVQSHERVNLPFASFISSCKLYIQNPRIKISSSVGKEDSLLSQVNSEESCSTSLDISDQLYLAQVPILSTESKERTQLEVLSDDILTPVFLRTKKLASINLWMTSARSRSSTHYDPYHNLLCIVAGSKQVVLWPPSACPLLYPMPIHGESSNHSAVDLKNPDFSIHPRAKCSREYSQEAILHSGDSLFIPEGWFHQVDSDDVTIAVNFWWMSNIMSSDLEHMDAYYLRRILNRLVGKEMNSMLPECSVSKLEGRENCEQANAASKGQQELDPNSQEANVNENGKKECTIVQHLDPIALNILYELISLVHDAFKVGGQSEAMECTSLEVSFVNPKDEYRKSAMDDASLFVTDPVANIFCAVEPLVLKRVLLAMAKQFPRTLESLILHTLSPTAAEILTRKFDEMDQLLTKEQQLQFYEMFYSVFDDPNSAMGAILKGKEAFAFQSVQNVMDKYLGLHVSDAQVVSRRS